MELRELISFYHVAKLSSVSKTARTLELGQPTVTTHLRKLEEELGITLFDRIKRPIRLTSEGANPVGAGNPGGRGGGPPSKSRWTMSKSAALS